MSILDEFTENYFLLLEIAYSPDREWPPYVSSKGKNTGGGICCRNGDALSELHRIEQGLAHLDRQILRFFQVDPAILRTIGKESERMKALRREISKRETAIPKVEGRE